jgi:hypothetical protein
MPPRFSLNTDLIVGVNAPLVFIGVLEVPALVNKNCRFWFRFLLARFTPGPIFRTKSAILLFANIGPKLDFPFYLCVELKPGYLLFFSFLFFSFLNNKDWNRVLVSS